MTPRREFSSLFLVSLSSIGFEIALSRYFALANWAEYGYWVISIAMTGYALSGVAVSLFKNFFQKRREAWLAVIPTAMMAAGAAGFFAACLDPFNPLELQNRELWIAQLLNIGKYYLALFPYFFLSGVFISLNFLGFPGTVAKLYAWDLLGAACGGALLLGLMTLLHPFYLLAGVLPFLALASLLTANNRKMAVASIVVFTLSELAILQYNQASLCEYKPVFAALHVEGDRVVGEKLSPRGDYLVLDNFTERLDADLSNNYGLLKAGGPPRVLGVYKDGNRVGSLPKTGEGDFSYLTAALDSFPYLLRPGAKTLLVGSRGGTRIREAMRLGAGEVTALEPDPVIYGLTWDGLTPAERQRLWNQSPQAFLSSGQGGFDLIDVSPDFLDQSEVNRYAFTVESVAADLAALKPGGVLSLPVSIREFTVYAAKLLETVAQALDQNGGTLDKNVLVCRSAWNTRVLVSNRPFTPLEIQSLKSFCDQRSFDVPYYQGRDALKTQVWNDLPEVSFADQAAPEENGEAQDALAKDALRVSTGWEKTPLAFYDLRPATRDRPYFASVLRLSRLKDILRRIEMVPREEVSWLVNLAVLALACLFALPVLILPLLAKGNRQAGVIQLFRVVLYFPALGLGFLFVEIFLLEKFSWFLNDRTSAFGLTLAAMLLFSGLGSYLSYGFREQPRRVMRVVVLVVGAWLVTAAFYLDPMLEAGQAWPQPMKLLLILGAAAPVSLALGFPFALGLSVLGEESARVWDSESASLLPWAYGLNGAFSIVATPLANLIAVSVGFRWLLAASLALYGLSFLVFPQRKK